MAKRGAEDVYQQERANLVARQGPFPPWCVGSTFSPPQLVTSNLCPLIYNQVGKPEFLISTGHEVELEEDTAPKLCEQTKSFMLSASAPFVPSELLQSLLEEDAALHKAESSQKKLYRGNRLESVKCSDGNVILLFPCGKSGEKIGSSLCYPRVDGAWYPVRNSSTAAACDDLDEGHLSESPSFSQTILQLSAVMLQPVVSDDHGHVYVAARTFYQVHFCVVLREVERIRFVSTYAATFQTQVSHVTWNPHLDRGAAVLLRNGEVSLFDVPFWRSGDINRMMDIKAKLTLENPAKSLRAKAHHPDSVSSLAIEIFDARNELNQSKENLDNTVDSRDEIWWRCEFAWHPQILLVSGLQKVVQMDYRRMCSSECTVEGPRCMNKKCPCDVNVVAEVGAPSALSRFCYTKPREEHILAFARADYDGMCKFSLATEKHLMLFDVRQVGAPILQWEHGMTDEPPDLLIMLQASTLQSNVDLGEQRNYQNGRAIVAVSFQSGDIRLFVYGSKGRSESIMRKTYSTMKDFEVDDWDDVTSAWEMPLKIYPPEGVANDWSDMLALPCLQFSKKVHGSTESKRPECISGIRILSHYSSESSTRISNRAFTMLQLTGWGDILLQQYKASNHSTIVPNFRLDSVSRGQDKMEGWEARKPKFLVLGAFFKYKRNISERAKGGASFHDVHNLKQEGMIRGSTEVIQLLAVKKEKNMSDRHFKIVLQHLSVPLSMFEVAHTVLRMGLPSTLLPPAARLPSDLEVRRQKGRKLCSFLPLIYSEPSSESADQTTSRNPVKPIPLSSLLEIRHWIEVGSSRLTENDCNKENLHVRGNCVSGADEDMEQAEGCNVASSSQFALGERIVPGQKLLLEAYSCVEEGLKELLEKQVSSVVSLSDPNEDCIKSELDNYILLHEISTDTFSAPSSGDNLTHADKVQNLINIAESDKDFEKDRWRSFGHERLSNFVAGKPLASKGKDKRDRLTKMEAEICPIKLSYTSAEEEEQLEEQEWTALENLQAQLLEWQQSFKPYRKLYG